MSEPLIEPKVKSLPNSVRSKTQRHPLLGQGEPAVWLAGGMAALSVLMILGLLWIILKSGATTFWPAQLPQIEAVDGKFHMGEVSRTDAYIPEGEKEEIARFLYKTGNFDLTNTDFTWLDERQTKNASHPKWAVVVERTEWGNAYGTLKALTVGDKTYDTPEAAWAKFQEVHPQMRDLADAREKILRDEMGEINRKKNSLRLELKKIAFEQGEKSTQYSSRVAAMVPEQEGLDAQMLKLSAAVREIEAQMNQARVLIETSAGKSTTTAGKVVPADRTKLDQPLYVWQVIRMYPANQLTFMDKLGIYFSRWSEYLFDDPREANMEGGVWPAIVGTVVMTMIMVILVVPIGVIASIYLREYARQGVVVSVIRVTVNNLAGVPSIVFGVFGLGFFVYGVGSFVDGGPKHPFIPNTWLTLAAIALAVGFMAIATSIGIYVADRKRNHKLKGFLKVAAISSWVLFLGFVALLVATNPFFTGFFRASLPDPTFGKTALVWASLTLALLTLPVVIVATEEALAAVPKSLREASYGCGATKWQTVWRVVLPRALPGVMTGAILAIARGAGEVAPLMLVGAVKLAPELPASLSYPFIHLNQSFMHLGFHIYDLGFQSRNSEAAKSMVYTTTLLLITIVVVLNLAAMWIRARLRKGYLDGHF